MKQKVKGRLVTCLHFMCPSTDRDPLGNGGSPWLKVFKGNFLPTFGWPLSYADSGVRPRKPGLKINLTPNGEFPRKMQMIKTDLR